MTVTAIPKPRMLWKARVIATPAMRVTPTAMPTVTPSLWPVVDVALAAAMLVIAAPVILAAMALVKLTSRGPVLYSQTRLGQRGRIYRIYKIRSMCHEAESLTGPRWSFPGDPRITPVGHILRKLHIDELPQLVNVLRGEMSLVGPRPERPEIAAELREVLPGYDRRLAVKPGITGLAQVHLPPDETISDVRRKLVYDRLGMARRGVLFNLGVMLMTTFKIVGHRGRPTRKCRKRSAIEMPSETAL